MIKIVFWSSYKNPLIIVRFKIFEKHLNVIFHEDQSSLRPVVPCWRTKGQTDWRDEANSCSS